MADSNDCPLCHEQIRNGDPVEKIQMKRNYENAHTKCIDGLFKKDSLSLAHHGLMKSINAMRDEMHYAKQYRVMTVEYYAKLSVAFDNVEDLLEAMK